MHAGKDGQCETGAGVSLSRPLSRFEAAEHDVFALVVERKPQQVEHL